MFQGESGFNTAMTRGYARAPSHLRAVGQVARNHGLNYTLICAVSLAGPLAPLVIERAGVLKRRSVLMGADLAKKRVRSAQEWPTER